MCCADGLGACVLVLLAAAMVTLLSGGIERFTNVSPRNFTRGNCLAQIGLTVAGVAMQLQRRNL